MTTTLIHEPLAEGRSPVAYVTMQDTAARDEIVAALAGCGWVVVPQPTGFHLIEAISAVIDGQETALRPDLIVVDAYSRGCSGVTIAAGLRDLGLTIPIVLAAAPGAPLPVSADPTLRIVDAASTRSAVLELAIAGSPSPSPSPRFSLTARHTRDQGLSCQPAGSGESVIHTDASVGEKPNGR